MSESPTTAENQGFDRGAAVTRSLLGYGVIAGPIYVVAGLAQAITRDGFDLSRHSLSLLANGSGGWVQIANFVLTGAMVLAAAIGIARAVRPRRAPALLVGAYGACLVLAGVFRADPVDGFPPGTPAGVPSEASAAGVVHLAAGGVGFLALAAGFWLLGRWFGSRNDARMSAGSRLAALVVAGGFVVGAATATTAVGIALLWLAVLAGWGWLAVASVAMYRTVPHPDLDRRS